MQSMKKTREVKVQVPKTERFSSHCEKTEDNGKLIVTCKITENPEFDID